MNDKITEIKSNVSDDKYFFVKHSSGLPIFIYPKPGYNSSYAIIGTRYGSINTTFEADGKLIKVPDGIAHYLEHKLFESEDGDAFSKYAKTGASANAFTSFDETCYLFSCTQNFEESLKILLDLIQSPYFTKEGVEKEQGIIGQEIRMYDDDPDLCLMYNLFNALYHNHPLKIDIAGTVESIREITPEKLYECYNAYYNLHNMVLCVVGDLDVNKVLKVADENLRSTKKVEVENIFPEEPDSIVTKRIEQNFEISVKMFKIGFKESAGKERASVKQMVCTDILLEAFSSTFSPLYYELMKKNLINTASFDGKYLEGPGYRSIIFSGESKDPDKVCEIIKEYADKLHENLIDKDTFEIVRKSVYGKYMASLNSTEIIGIEMVNGYFSGASPFDYLDCIKSVTLDDVNKRLEEELLSDKCALSVVSPLKGDS